MPSITCAKCKSTHHSVEAVKECFAGATIAPCNWLVERIAYDCDDISYTVTEDCGAEAIYNDRGFECEAGHAHVRLEIQAAEGWSYAEDRDEAASLAKAGIFPVQMDGRMFV